PRQEVNADADVRLHPVQRRVVVAERVVELHAGVAERRPPSGLLHALHLPQGLDRGHQPTTCTKSTSASFTSTSPSTFPLAGLPRSLSSSASRSTSHGPRRRQITPLKAVPETRFTMAVRNT